MVKFRAKSLISGNVKTSFWVYGAYHKHLSKQPYALYHDLKEPDKEIESNTKHLIIFDDIADWGMERKLKVIDIIPETVGQSIGLCDIKGNEIYEGDILLYTYKSIRPNDTWFERKYTAFVEKNSQYAKYQIRFLDNYSTMDFESVLTQNNDDVIATLEIIGNIHDNKELLKNE